MGNELSATIGTTGKGAAHRLRRVMAGCAVTVCLGAQLLAAQDVHLELVASGLAGPVFVTHAGDDRLFIVESVGRIRFVRGGALEPKAFLDISDRVLPGGERGLLSVAFHPNYAENGRFFVYYTRKPAGDVVIARFERDPLDSDRALPASEARLLSVDQPFANHNGGQLQFGPDGMLYAALGDGGSGNDPSCNAQRSDTLLGKMLRLDVDVAGGPPYYRVPLDNPFRFSPFADEVWALGLRNPWRFSFDQATGEMYIGDVGQNAREEIDLQPPGLGGLNYGWKVWEGTRCTGNLGGCPASVGDCSDSSYFMPLLDYSHSGGACSITGGYVYRGSKIPDLVGSYLYGDFCAGIVVALSEPSGAGGRTRLLPISVPSLSSFGEDSDGELYVVSLEGKVFKIVGPEPKSPGTIEFAISTLSIAEGSSAQVEVRRVAGTDGTVSVRVSAAAGTASEGEFVPVDQILSWGDGDDSPRFVSAASVDDDLVEGSEDFRLLLTEPEGAALGAISELSVNVVDNEQPGSGCTPTAERLCLQSRFAVEVDWVTADGNTGAGQAVPLTQDTGSFWFFGANNLEVFVKVIDACAAPFDHFWVFLSGLTNVSTVVTVVDTETLESRVYKNPQGTPFQPVQDTAAFATCP